MGMTMTQKLLAAHCGREYVRAGDIIMADCDMVLGNDITAPVAINEFHKTGKTRVFDREKIALVLDHFVPNKDIKSAQNSKKVRDFAGEMGIVNFFDVGNMGIEHALLPEKGLVTAGDLVIGADSHTCTYGALGAFSTGVGSTDMAAAMAIGKVWLKVPSAIRFDLSGKLNKYVTGKDLILHIIGMIGVDGALYQSMEFSGEGVQTLSVSDRLCVSNMAIEAGAKNGIFAPDAITRDYVKTKAKRDYKLYASDADAVYADVIEINAEKIEPQVAFPHLPSNVRGISKAGRIKIDQSLIGSCTNGRIEDLRIAAKILKNRKAASGVRLIVVPATPEIYKRAMKEGLLDIFMKADAVISPPSCGACLGGHLGILAEGEKAVATTNRNFVGRMGHTKSEVYLASPAVAAASAVLGRIASPEEL